MNSPRSIYLDHAATTPVAAEVIEAMIPYLIEEFGNPSSIHRWGREARAAIDGARDSVAAAISADYSEIYFTSNGTEADNLAVIGTMLAAPKDRYRLIVSAVEHHAVLHAAHFLEANGYSVHHLPVNSLGAVEPEALHIALREPAALVSIMHANNEIGTIQDIARLARISHEAGALFHTDAIQSFGSLPIHVKGLGCDLLSLSAHKVYGPKGAGALYIRSGVKVSPLMLGGTQEREKRAGTENTAAIVGFGKAAELAIANRETESLRLAELRDRFIGRLEELIPGVVLNGPRGHRLPNNVNVSIPGLDGPGLLMSLDLEGIAASSGAACSSGSIEPSHVLRAIGLSPDLTVSGLRFSLGRSTTESDLEETAYTSARIVERLRG